MRIAFTSPPASGHLNPMTALARKLRSRGHEVIFFGLSDAEPAIRAAGIDFLPVCQKEYPPGELARQLHRVRLLSGAEAVQFTLNFFAKGCRATFEDGPRAMRELRTDALVLDTASRGFDLVAMHMGIPYAHVSNALHVDYSGHTPLCFYDWPYEPGPEAFARNRQVVEMFLKVTRQLREIKRECAGQMGLKLDWDDPTQTISRLAWLSQTPKEFDFPGDHWPAYFHHTGPLHDGFGRVPADFQWESLTGEDLVYASMGTLQTASEGVFRTIVEAVAAPGRQIVLSIGRNLRREQIGAVPANTIVVPYAPQIEILKRAALCITHAGLNTALESLAQGVPMVAIPLTNDQPGVASRIAYTRTGLVVPLKELTAERLRATVDRVMADPSYGESARRLQQAIQRTNGLELAANLLESAFGTTTRRAAVRDAPLASQPRSI